MTKETFTKGCVRIERTTYPVQQWDDSVNEEVFWDDKLILEINNDYGRNGFKSVKWMIELFQINPDNRDTFEDQLVFVGIISPKSILTGKRKDMDHIVKCDF